MPEKPTVEQIQNLLRVWRDLELVWATSPNPERKLRLLAIALARLLPKNELSAKDSCAFEIAESVAAGQLSIQEARTPQAFGRFKSRNALESAWRVLCEPKELEATIRQEIVMELLRHPALYDSALECLGCIVGEMPPRKYSCPDGWRTSTAISIAESIYELGAFDRMPILADALEDAGCDDEAILQHCRTGSSHVRGCWVIEALLEMS